MIRLPELRAQCYVVSVVAVAGGQMTYDSRWCSVMMCVASIWLVPNSSTACWRAVRNPPLELPADGSELPANMVQWLFRASGSNEVFKLWATAPDGETKEIPFQCANIDALSNPRPHIISLQECRATEQLTIGTELRFERQAGVKPDGEMFEQETSLTYTIGRAVDEPERLGTITAEQQIGTLRIADAGRCYIDLQDASYATISLDLAQDARPVEPMLRYELRIDGERSWTYDDGEQNETRLWTSSRGAGKDVVYLACHGEITSELFGTVDSLPSELREKVIAWRQVLEPGEHRVEMIGRLPDGRELTSNALIIDLHCDGGGAAPREAPELDDAQAVMVAETGTCADLQPMAALGLLLHGTCDSILGTYAQALRSVSVLRVERLSSARHLHGR